MKISAHECAQMIENAGGLQAFARLLDPTRRFASNTILWWKKNGIAAEIQLEYYDHLQRLRENLLKNRL